MGVKVIGRRRPTIRDVVSHTTVSSVDIDKEHAEDDASGSCICLVLWATIRASRRGGIAPGSELTVIMVPPAF